MFNIRLRQDEQNKIDKRAKLTKEMNETLLIQFAEKIKNEESYKNSIKLSEENRLKKEEAKFMKDKINAKQEIINKKRIYGQQLENQIVEKNENKKKEVPKDKHFLRKINPSIYTENDYNL